MSAALLLRRLLSAGLAYVSTFEGRRYAFLDVVALERSATAEGGPPRLLALIRPPNPPPVRTPLWDEAPKRDARDVALWSEVSGVPAEEADWLEEGARGLYTPNAGYLASALA